MDFETIRAQILDEAAIVWPMKSSPSSNKHKRKTSFPFQLCKPFGITLQVFSTLGFSGAAVSKLNSSFDVVIIDEAAQAVSILNGSSLSLFSS